ncbi:MAG TPA: ROK family protein [Acholeplasma sp.]|nr:ROK family protein [Acholeplasma sp.]
MSKTSNSQSIKKENMRVVMETLIEYRVISRIELSRITTLNKATISSIMNEFLENDLVVETNKTVKTYGRSAKLIALNKNAGRIISLELLFDSLYGIIANLYGEVLYEVKKPISNPEFKPYLKVILEAIDELKANTHDSTYGLIGIGIGVYGTISNNQKIKYAPFNSWKDIDLNQIITDYTGIETYVANEANISALGEHIISKTTRNLVSINIGLGVGMGIITNDKLYTGEFGYAGEIGHTIVVPNGRKCICGNHGCLETYISDNAILKQYASLSGKSITMDQFILLYQQKDSFALDVLNDFTDFTAIAINNISQILNPHTIIINSKIASGIPETISDVKNKLNSQLMRLETLITSTDKYKTNILGLTHILIQKFLDVEKYVIKLK